VLFPKSVAVLFVENRFKIAYTEQPNISLESLRVLGNTAPDRNAPYHTYF